MTRRSITYSRTSASQVRKLDDQTRERVRIAVEAIADDPLKGKKLKGPLSPLRSYRVWPLRTIYNFTAHALEVWAVEHRKDVYRL